MNAEPCEAFCYSAQLFTLLPYVLMDLQPRFYAALQFADLFFFFFLFELLFPRTSHHLDFQKNGGFFAPFHFCGKAAVAEKRRGSKLLCLCASSVGSEHLASRPQSASVA